MISQKTFKFKIISVPDANSQLFVFFFFFFLDKRVQLFVVVCNKSHTVSNPSYFGGSLKLLWF